MSDLQAYAEAARVIKEAILRSQYRAASVANKEQLSLYYGIGCYVSKNSREGFWGKGAIETISQQLQKELPGLRSFSATNIKNMRSFYKEWSPVINRQPMADEFNWADFVAIGKRKLSSFVFVCISFCTFVILPPKKNLKKNLKKYCRKKKYLYLCNVETKNVKNK